MRAKLPQALFSLASFIASLATLVIFVVMFQAGNAPALGIAIGVVMVAGSGWSLRKSLNRKPAAVT